MLIDQFEEGSRKMPDSKGLRAEGVFDNFAENWRVAVAGKTILPGGFQVHIKYAAIGLGISLLVSFGYGVFLDLAEVASKYLLNDVNPCLCSTWRSCGTHLERLDTLS